MFYLHVWEAWGRRLPLFFCSISRFDAEVSSSFPSIWLKYLLREDRGKHLCWTGGSRTIKHKGLHESRRTPCCGKSLAAKEPWTEMKHFLLLPAEPPLIRRCALCGLHPPAAWGTQVTLLLAVTGRCSAGGSEEAFSSRTFTLKELTLVLEKPTTNACVPVSWHGHVLF